MRVIVTVWLAALAAGASPSMAADGDGPPRHRPGPEQLFQRLDADKDGQLVPDEFPPPMKERLSALLERADKNDDKKLSKEEFAKAMKGRRPAPPPWAGRGPGDRPGPPDARPEDRPRRPGPPKARRGDSSRRPGPPVARRGDPHRGRHGPAASRGPRFHRPGPATWAMKHGRGRPSGPPAWAARGGYRGRWASAHWGRPGAGRRPGIGARYAWARARMRGPGAPWGMMGPSRRPDPKAVFARLDKDDDKKLSLEEFAAGVRAWRPAHRGPQGPSAARPVRRPGMLLERLKAADKNKDGKLSKDEAPGPLKENF